MAKVSSLRVVTNSQLALVHVSTASSSRHSHADCSSSTCLLRVATSTIRVVILSHSLWSSRSWWTTPFQICHEIGPFSGLRFVRLQSPLYVKSIYFPLQAVYLHVESFTTSSCSASTVWSMVPRLALTLPRTNGSCGLKSLSELPSHTVTMLTKPTLGSTCSYWHRVKG